VKARTANTITISSSDHVSFSIPLAGPMTRFLAWMIDAGVIMVVLIGVNMLVGYLSSLSLDLAMGFFIAFNFILVTAYGIEKET